MAHGPVEGPLQAVGQTGAARKWAAFLKRWGGIHSMGEHCYIQTDVNITDPALVRMGNNVCLSGCTLF